MDEAHAWCYEAKKKPITIKLIIITWVEEECSKGLYFLVASLCRSIWSHLCLFKQLICNTNTELNGCVTVYFYMHYDSYSPWYVLFLMFIYTLDDSNNSNTNQCGLLHILYSIVIGIWYPLSLPLFLSLSLSYQNYLLLRHSSDC